MQRLTTYEDIVAHYKADDSVNEVERSFRHLGGLLELNEELIYGVQMIDNAVAGDNADGRILGLVEPVIRQVVESESAIARMLDTHLETGRFEQGEVKGAAKGIRLFFNTMDQFRDGILKIAGERHAAGYTGREIDRTATAADYWGPVRSKLVEATKHLDDASGRIVVEAAVDMCTHMVALGDRLAIVHGLDNFLPDRSPAKKMLHQREHGVPEHEKAVDNRVKEFV